MLTPPKIPQKLYFHEEHGVRREDPYFWLQDPENIEVIDHLRDENAYTNSYLSSYLEIKQTVYQETLSRIQETDQDYPWSYGDYEYYFRTIQGLQHDIFCRKLKNSDQEEILFDENEHASYVDFFEVGQYSLDLTQTKMIVSVDLTGDEKYNVVLLDIHSSNKKKIRIEEHVILKGVSSSVVFSTNNRDIWYCKYDDTQRPFQVWCHDILGEQPDLLVYEEKDELFSVSIFRTMSDAYLVIQSSSKLTSESWIIDAHNPRGVVRVFRERIYNREYDIDHQGHYFYMRTNEDGPTFALKRCPIDDFCLPSFETIIPVNPDIPLDNIAVFDEHIVLECRREGLSQIAILRAHDLQKTWLTFDEPSYSVGLSSNWEYYTNILRLSYTSLKTPPQDFSLNMDTFEKTLLKQSPVLGEFDSKNYTTERLFAKAIDGTLIPISLVYKTSLKKPCMPLLLTGYGAYGIDNDPNFSYTRLSLLDRGFIYAVAHIRGGGEFGDPWHEAGRFLNKKNTFDDFIACAKYLIEEQYTDSKNLVISGGSAGGLLMGAVLNQAPELFCAAIAQVPFVDSLNTMLDNSLPLTVLEYEEWGNPHNKIFYDYMKSYAPYENIQHQAYPAIFATAGLHDPRVPYWEAAKWVARLRDFNTGDNPILLRVLMSAGHSGPSGRYHAIEEVAEEFAFILSRIGS